MLGRDMHKEVRSCGMGMRHLARPPPAGPLRSLLHLHHPGLASCPEPRLTEPLPVVTTLPPQAEPPGALLAVCWFWAGLGGVQGSISGPWEQQAPLLTLRSFTHRRRRPPPPPCLGRHAGNGTKRRGSSAGLRAAAQQPKPVRLAGRPAFPRAIVSGRAPGVSPLPLIREGDRPHEVGRRRLPQATMGMARQ